MSVRLDRPLRSALFGQALKNIGPQTGTIDAIRGRFTSASDPFRHIRHFGREATLYLLPERWPPQALVFPLLQTFLASRLNALAKSLAGRVPALPELAGGVGAVDGGCGATELVPGPGVDGAAGAGDGLA